MQEAGFSSPTEESDEPVGGVCNYSKVFKHLAETRPIDEGCTSRE